MGVLSILTRAFAAPASAHRGAVLPAARVVVLAVPLLALSFYVFVVRRRPR